MTDQEIRDKLIQTTGDLSDKIITLYDIHHDNPDVVKLTIQFITWYNAKPTIPEPGNGKYERGQEIWDECDRLEQVCAAELTKEGVTTMNDPTTQTKGDKIVATGSIVVGKAVKRGKLGAQATGRFIRDTGAPKTKAAAKATATYTKDNVIPNIRKKLGIAKSKFMEGIK